MTRRHNILLAVAFCALFPAHAFAQDRAEAEASVRTEVMQDLASPWQPEALKGRVCVDGRPAADVAGDVVEYWVNLECSYCGIVEPVWTQRQNAAMRIAVHGNVLL
ncbi:MAG: hypothetical protein LBC79_01235 [Deltaproteobacteria bacterium]|jgi:hypothetical protein|nr:hypothetical protein [Deltaproteobacteria bacterium]